MAANVDCTVYIFADGALSRLADGSPADDPLAPTVLTDLKITWGRETVMDQPNTSTCAFRILDPPGGPKLNELVLGTRIVVKGSAVVAGEIQTVSVFTGKVCALAQAWDDSADDAVIEVQAVDFTAELENTMVGEEPWQWEYFQDRFARICNATTLTEWTIAPSFPTTLGVTMRDVDAQGAYGLLTELATTIDGVLWAASSADGTQTRLYLEDPGNRENVTPVTLSACEVDRDGVTYMQDVQDITTRVSVTWYREVTDDDGKRVAEEQSTTLVNEDREALYGRRSLSLNSQLRTEATAQGLAAKILARTSGGWRISQLRIDDATNGPHVSGGILTNYVVDPSGEYNGLTWGDTAPIRLESSSTSQVRTGQYSWEFRGGTAGGPDDTVAFLAVSVPPGATTVTCAGWYYWGGPSTMPGTFTQGLAGDGTTAATSPEIPLPPSTNLAEKFQRFTITTEVTAGGTVEFYPVSSLTFHPDTTSGRKRFFVDDLSITFDSVEPADFSGDTESTDPDVTYAWTGIRGSSTSIRTTSGSLEDYVLGLLRILDIDNRNGLPLILRDMPSWTLTGSEVGLYLEGGNLTYSAGAWLTDLTVSNGEGAQPDAPTLYNLSLFVPGTLADFPVVYGTNSTLETIANTPIYL